jgi:hypothetical protein
MARVSAYWVAYSALRYAFEKKSDRSVKKDHKGPSDPRAANPRARENRGRSFGGVDLNGHTKEELRKRAAELDVRGRPAMTSEQLAQAIARQQDPPPGPASRTRHQGQPAGPASRWPGGQGQAGR